MQNIGLWFYNKKHPKNQNKGMYVCVCINIYIYQAKYVLFYKYNNIYLFYK